MKCRNCGSTQIRKNGKDPKTGMQKYYCADCKSAKTPIMDGENSMDIKPLNGKPKIGMTLNEFREKHDVDYIVEKTLTSLNRNMIYEKNDINKLTGLRPGYPGLSQTIDDKKKYYGKVGSTLYFSHPDTIAELKEQAKLI